MNCAALAPCRLCTRLHASRPLRGSPPQTSCTSCTICHACISAVPSAGERSYHIFYQMLAGVSGDERKALRLLSSPSEYNYFSEGEMTVSEYCGMFLGQKEEYGGCRWERCGVAGRWRAL